MEATLALIQQWSNERYDLYVEAGTHYLTEQQRNRLAELNRELPRLWDQYRRELAAFNRPVQLVPDLATKEMRPAA